MLTTSSTGSHRRRSTIIKEFECRKSADAYARSGESKTGVLDTSKLTLTSILKTSSRK